jgi:hypothetical protein
MRMSSLRSATRSFHLSASAASALASSCLLSSATFGLERAHLLAQAGDPLVDRALAAIGGQRAGSLKVLA